MINLMQMKKNKIFKALFRFTMRHKDEIVYDGVYCYDKYEQEGIPHDSYRLIEDETLDKYKIFERKFLKFYGK